MGHLWGIWCDTCGRHDCTGYWHPTQRPEHISFALTVYALDADPNDSHYGEGNFVVFGHEGPTRSPQPLPMTFYDLMNPRTSQSSQRVIDKTQELTLRASVDWMMSQSMQYIEPSNPILSGYQNTNQPLEAMTKQSEIIHGTVNDDETIDMNLFKEQIKDNDYQVLSPKKSNYQSMKSMLYRTECTPRDIDILLMMFISIIRVRKYWLDLILGVTLLIYLTNDRGIAGCRDLCSSESIWYQKESQFVIKEKNHSDMIITKIMSKCTYRMYCDHANSEHGAKGYYFSDRSDVHSTIYHRINWNGGRSDDWISQIKQMYEINGHQNEKKEAMKLNFMRQSEDDTLTHRLRRCLKCRKCQKCRIIHNFWTRIFLHGDSSVIFRLKYLKCRKCLKCQIIHNALMHDNLLVLKGKPLFYA